MNKRGNYKQKPTPEEIVQKVKEYLASCIDEETERVKSYNPETGATTYELGITAKIPTIEGFSLFSEVPLTSLYELRYEHESVSQALDLITQAQKEKVLAKGLENKYNATIAKLILSSNHGMSDRAEVNQNLNITGIDVTIQDD